MYIRMNYLFVPSPMHLLISPSVYLCQPTKPTTYPSILPNRKPTLALVAPIGDFYPTSSYEYLTYLT